MRQRITSIVAAAVLLLPIAGWAETAPVSVRPPGVQLPGALVKSGKLPEKAPVEVEAEPKTIGVEPPVDSSSQNIAKAQDENMVYVDEDEIKNARSLMFKQADHEKIMKIFTLLRFTENEVE